jgi:subtilisin family serine protease
MTARKSLLYVAFAAILAVVGCQNSDLPTSNDAAQSSNPAASKFTPNPDPGSDRYIVVLNDETASGTTSFSKTVSDISGQFGVAADRVFKNTITGFSARMTAQQASALAASPRVKYVEPDYKVQLVTYPVLNTVQSNGQIVPWGVTRVGGSRDGSGKTAWIVDTGLDLYNSDLNVDLTRSRNFVPDGRTNAQDGNGHGTHVGGIIGAKNNAVGVVGVAPNATLVAVRVLDNNGSGYYSSIISGLDYVTANAHVGDVVNMSLGGPVSSALDDAVRRVASRGTKVVVAAGNSAVNASNTSPAHVNASNIYTVSATDQYDRYASFSNFGNPPIDVAAPGVSVLSTRLGGGTIYMSGTSMAAPHVAGLLIAGYVSVDGKAQNDPDGNADWIAHR